MTKPPHSSPKSADAPPGRIEFLARGLMIWGDSVLVCRNLKHGYCYLPGGHVEPGESAADACSREFLEETGLAVKAGGCVLVHEARFTQKSEAKHELSAVFHVEHPARNPSAPGLLPPAMESLEAKIGFEWIAREQLAGTDLRPASLKVWLLGRRWGVSVGDTAGPDWISSTE